MTEKLISSIFSIDPDHVASQVDLHNFFLSALTKTDLWSQTDMETWERWEKGNKSRCLIFFFPFIPVVFGCLFIFSAPCNHGILLALDSG